MSARLGSWQPAVTVVSYFTAAEKCRRFGRLEGVGSALGDDVPFVGSPVFLLISQVGTPSSVSRHRPNTGGEASSISPGYFVSFWKQFFDAISHIINRRNDFS